MRKTLWTLGTLSALGLALTVSTAQDRVGSNTARPRSYTYLGKDAEKSAGDKTEAASEEQDAQRYSRSRGAATGATGANGLKNYHNELFGKDAAGAPATRPGTTAAVTSQKLNSSKAPTREGAIQQTNGTNKGPEAGAIRQAGGVVNADEEGGVTRADFATDSKTKANQIKQVSGSKAPALPDLDEAPVGKSDLILLPDQPPVGKGKPTPGKTEVAPAKAKPTNVGTNLSKDGKRLESSGRSTAGVTNFSREAPRIMTEWKKLGDLNVGQTCAIELVVSNAGGAAASDVAVDAYFPASIRITDAKPEPSAASDHVTWNFKSIGANEEKRIALTIIPSQRGELAANANVRFTSAASTVFTVEEPQLKLAVTGPSQVTVGEPATQVVTITNPGTGVAHNVTIDVVIPEGLEHARGNRLQMELGSLTPGETRSVKLSLNAKQGGAQTVKVEAKAGTDLRQAAASKIDVLAPSLKLAVAGPALRYVGRDARYTVNVKNDGEAITNNVRAVYVVPKSFEFIHASNGGAYDEAHRTITWFLGSIDSGKTTELSVKLRPTELGEFAHVARATSEHGSPAESRVSTKIEGAASLVLEVVDLDDPVEVGRETAYEVRVRNDGSKEAQNVGLSIELPTSIQLIGVKAPVDHLAESGLLVFKSLPALPPGKTAIFHITCKGKDEGNQRLRARLTSDSIQEPLTVEELTKFYAD